ncbi:hypothetical protein LINPERHAP1_LOCUS7019 [Linum perenne]
MFVGKGLDVALASILSHLVTPQSYVRFSIVCKQWHSVAKDLHRHHIVTTENQVPFLLFGTKDTKTSSDHHRQGRLYSVIQDKLFDLKLRMPTYVTKECLGFSHGWLAYARVWGDIVRNIALYNPFTRARIDLPLISTDTSNFQFDDSRGSLSISKLILSADPSQTEDYIVAHQQPFAKHVGSDSTQPRRKVDGPTPFRVR